MVSIIHGKLRDRWNKPVSSQKLSQYFEQHQKNLEGSLYLGYPIIGTSQGGYQLDAILISRKHGIVIFNIIEDANFNNIDCQIIEETQDESVNKLQSKLLPHKTLTHRRKLAIEISVITYAPAWPKQPRNWSDEYDLAIEDDQLTEFLNRINWDNKQLFEQLNSVIQTITTIRKRGQRSYVKQPNSRGAKLKKLEESIANLDKSQSKAVIETVEGVQRIRGLAGSGKTIVLALKVAYLHAVHPEWKIAVTFNTRSLKGQFKHFINTFTIEQTNEEPNWDKVKIVHAWGSPKIEGIYYDICKKHNIEYFDFSSASKITQNFGEEFDTVCQKAVSHIKKFEEDYDLILIDEAQDFSKYFLQLCYGILKQPKRLIYAYDELQNLSSSMMASPEEIFGSDSQGNPRVKLENIAGKAQQDIVLNTCYRNSRPILASAHALGFGIYREQGLVQIFEYPSLWKDIGYELIEGQLTEGSRVQLKRTHETSPEFLESHSPLDDLIIFKVFEDKMQQINWLVQQIQINLEKDELKPSDIMIVHTDPRTTRAAVSEARNLLFKKGIQSNLAGVTTSPDDFFDDRSVVFTSIYRAKGNEAAMVYVLDAHKCFSGSELSKKRNILFTAMTRSKAWLRVIGYGDKMNQLKKEFERIKTKNFELQFTYPTQEERKQMKLLNKDMTPQEKNKLKQRKNNLKDVANALAKGEMKKEDIPQDVLEKLKALVIDS